MPTKTQPAFVTFTGADDASLCKSMSELSAKYPIEWGILVDRDKAGRPLFPLPQHIDRFRQLGVRLCAHICGSVATDIARGAVPTLNLGGFSRIQINHGREGASAAVVSAVQRFANLHTVRGVLQCRDLSFPTEYAGVDWLYDVSFGEGVRPTSFPQIEQDLPFCGISGGIGPDNVETTLDDLVQVAPGTAFWIDMESGVRTNGVFDLGRCKDVCERVYGKR
ncbi:MAG: hypothetical protein WBM57_13425 [Woeseiaceae bacterium]